jgi:flagellar L-ring protein precursor FlgH
MTEDTSMYRLLIALLVASALLAGCAPAKTNPAPAPVLTPPPAEAVSADENPGSLYDPAQGEFLFADNRARRVGDIVLVNIVETSKANTKADTTSDKTSSLNLGVTSMLGKNDSRLWPVGPSLGYKIHPGTTAQVEASSTSKFSGTGETKRENNVTATLAARVVNILPGGVMQIEGAREIKVNNENQILVVRGLIRSKDVRPDNSILSSSIADAHIEYYGQGVLGDKQKPGWLTRLLDNVWPF